MKIGLCLPSYDGRVHDAHMVSVHRSMLLAASQGVEIMHIIGRGSPILPDTRNWLVAHALEAGCDKIWFVDSDISWETCVPEALNMLRAPVDIVAGVHQKKNSLWNEQPARMVVGWGQVPPPVDEETGLWEVNRVATAFVAIDRSVFERLADAGIARNYLPHRADFESRYYRFNRNYFWYDFQPAVMDQRTADHLEAVGYDGPMESIEGEDYYFCRKAKEVGCRVFVDPRITLTHFDGCVQHNVGLKDVRFEAVEPILQAAE
jgi:hypothetical protein